MMYVGLVTNGGNIPADECLAGVVAIPIALASGMDAQLLLSWRCRLVC